MPRLVIVTFTLAVVFIALALGGCTGGTANIKGNASDGFGAYHAISGVLIMAIPQDGGATVTNVSDDGGNYTLKLRPNVPYNISGRYYDPYGQHSLVNILYPNGEFCNTVKLAPGETIGIKTQVINHHPPKSFSMKYDPITGSMEEFAPPTPVSISGRVYLDGKAVSGVSVEAVSAYGVNNTSTVTGEDGTYILGLGSRTQYNITATYQGLRHTVWPVFVLDNETDVYDINLTRAPRTTLSGTYTGWGPGSERPASVTIEATPAGGGTPIAVTAGPDSGYNFNLDVELLTYYDIRGRYRGPDGYNYTADFTYRTGVMFSGFLLHPNETALINYFTYEDNVTREKSPSP